MDTGNSAYFVPKPHGTQRIKKAYPGLMVRSVYSAGFPGFSIKDYYPGAKSENVRLGFLGLVSMVRGVKAGHLPFLSLVILNTISI